MILEAPATTTLTTDTPALAADPPVGLLVDPPGQAPADASGKTPAAAPGDATYGWEMFVAFTAAVLAMSIVVCVLALIGSWWMLGVAVAVHIGITATMMRLVMGAFGAEEHAYPDMHSAEAASRAAISARAGATAARAPSQLAVEH